VWHGDRDKFLATLVAPVRFQKILFPIFAFNYEISRIAFQTSEPALAEIKLKWWEEELTSIKKKNLSNKHEILAELSEIIITNNIPIQLFIEIISARRFDIYNDPHNNFEDQVHYIKQIFSSLFEICLHASSSLVDKNQINCVRDYGYALGVANLLVALPALFLAGKKPLFIEGTQEESIQKLTESGLQALLDGWRQVKTSDF
jgi:phytoene/squalene synthetase